MDSSITAALSAILGSTVGGLTTFATTFLNHRYIARRDMLAKDVANREQLYSEFLKEVANLYRDSISRTLDDLSQQASVITMYWRTHIAEFLATSAKNECEMLLGSVNGVYTVVSSAIRSTVSISSMLRGLTPITPFWRLIASRIASWRQKTSFEMNFDDVGPYTGFLFPSLQTPFCAGEEPSEGISYLTQYSTSKNP